MLRKIREFFRGPPGMTGEMGPEGAPGVTIAEVIDELDRKGYLIRTKYACHNYVSFSIQRNGGTVGWVSWRKRKRDDENWEVVLEQVDNPHVSICLCSVRNSPSQENAEDIWAINEKGM